MPIRKFQRIFLVCVYPPSPGFGTASPRLSGSPNPVLEPFVPFRGDNFRGFVREIRAIHGGISIRSGGDRRAGIEV
jgi:hypothetical protein